MNRSRRIDRASHRCGLALAAASATLLLLAGSALVHAQDDYDAAAIAYRTTPAVDAVSRLQSRIDNGTASLSFSPKYGWLPSVLKALNVPISSQMLVFSKTSFQRELISPKSPRALYFNDDTYVGYVQGGPVLELTTQDPRLGTVFYLIKQEPAAKPRLLRIPEECLQCHTSNMTANVPGIMMRSVYPDGEGQPILPAGTFVTSDQSPMEERWGGWYVTGRNGGRKHLGNAVFKETSNGTAPIYAPPAEVAELSRFINVKDYPSPKSDIVALMVSEHQTRVHNLITRASYQTRIALKFEEDLNRDLKRPLDTRSDSTLHRIQYACEPLVQGLLFHGESILPAPVVGSSGFTTAFSAEGPRDARGRSLRDFELQRRLFRYPCSYLVYSASFNGLPPLARDYVYARLQEVLTSPEPVKEYEQLTPADRRAIFEILLATKADFAAWVHAHPATKLAGPP